MSGDRIRVFHLMRELRARGWGIRVWSLVGPDEPAGFDDALRSVADEVTLVPRWPGRTRRIAGLARDMATGRAFQAGWFWSAAASREAASWLSDGVDDPIFVEQLYMYPFVPQAMRRRISLDTQNHEGTRVRAMAAGGGSAIRRWVAGSQVGAVDRYERSVLASVGNVLAVSESEASVFEPMAPGRVHLVPNGVDVEAIAPLLRPTPSRDLMFLGSLGYGANVDAVSYFSDEVTPLLAGSGITLSVVGGGGGAPVRRAASEASIPVHVTGFVPDIAPFFQSSRLMIVPLRHGGGTRLKILEALAWGLPVVATTLGAAGLGLVDGRHVLIADDPRSFAAAIQRVVTDDRLWTQLSTNGRAHVQEHFGWRRIGEAADLAMRELVEPSAP